MGATRRPTFNGCVCPAQLGFSKQYRLVIQENPIVHDTLRLWLTRTQTRTDRLSHDGAGPVGCVARRKCGVSSIQLCMLDMSLAASLNGCVGTKRVRRQRTKAVLLLRGP